MRWYVLRSKPNKEEALWREISARGQEACYPRLRVRPVNPRVRKAQPYFPGYMFVRLNHLVVGPASDSSVPFSQGLVAFGGEPAEVPDGMVAATRARVHEVNAAGGQGLAGGCAHRLDLKPEEAAMIQDGPFTGYMAIFGAHLAGSNRVRVLLQLLQQRPMTLALPAAHIEVTNQP